MLPRLFLVLGAMVGWAVFVDLVWATLLLKCMELSVRLIGHYGGLGALPGVMAWTIIMFAPGFLVVQAISFRTTSVLRDERRAEMLARDWS